MNDEDLAVSLKDFKRALQKVKEEYSKPATTERAGPIVIGGGLSVEQDGTASVDLSTLTPEQVEEIASKIVPSEEAVDAMLDSEFQPYQPET